MFRRVSDFLATWHHESDATLRLLRSLDDRSLAQPSGDHRSIGRVAWHLALTLGEMMERTGLSVGGPAHEAPVPAQAAEIASTYDAAAKAVARQVKDWTDATLEVEDDMYGERWARGRTLFALVAHQTHHRGQLTVLMRQAGLPVVGVYGPAKEEWSAYGMTPPAV